MKYLLIFILIFSCNFISYSSENNSLRVDTLFSISGKIFDAENKSTLSGVNIRVADSDKGAISKKTGDFKLHLTYGKHTLVFSMIGRVTKFVDINLDSDVSNYDIYLYENSLMTADVLVIAEDPGMRLMRVAIDKKNNNLKEINNYTYSLYTKFVAATDTLTAGRNEDNTDTTIVSIFESFSEGYFSAPDKFFNNIIQRRQSANIPPQANFVAFGTNVNAYDDYITILSNEISTPFHSSATEYYDFLLDKNYKNIENKSIARIIASPNSVRKLFTGIIYMDTVNFSPISVELYPNTSVQLPFGTKLSLNQTFTIIENKFTVPEYLKIKAEIDADIFWVISPRIDLKIENFISNFKFNIDLPQGIFSNRRVEIAKSADNFDSTFWKENLLVKLDEKEKEAYLAITRVQQNPDSALGTTMLDEIIGPINRVMAQLNRYPFTGFEDIFRFNRVQGAYLGLGIRQDLSVYNDLYMRYGYGFADKNSNYFANINQYFDEDKQFGVGLNLYSELKNIDYQNTFRLQSQALISLVFKNDYYDYFYNSGYQIDLKASFGQLRFLRRDVFIRPTRLNVYFRSENHRSATKNSEFSLFPTSRNFRENPPIIDGNLNSFGFEFNWYYHPSRRFENFGLQIGAEFSKPEIIESNFDFIQYYGGLLFRTETFPLWKMDVKLSAGYGIGNIPPQKFFSLESSVAGISSQRAFRGMGVKEFYGTEYMSLSIEHNFGEIIPGMLRIPNIAEFGIEFVTFANIGWSNFTGNTIFAKRDGVEYILKSTSETPDKYYYEVGLGLNKLLIFFRFDLTARLSQLDKPAFFFTFTSATF